MSKKQQTFEYKSQQDKLLKMVRSSIYTSKDVFLRELISNSYDAHNRLKAMLLINDDLVSEEYEPKITICVDGEKLIIEDNATGMTYDEMIENLGTIARSGTEEFFKNADNEEQKKNMIGQFGVGFYSAFMVAEKVEVISKSVKAKNKKDIWRWESKYEDNKFTIEKAENENISHGTKIILYISEDEKEFLNKFTIEGIVQKYSDNINCKIIFIDKDGKEEQINSGLALWERNKSSITKEQYQDFFRSVAHVGGEPWATLHNECNTLDTFFKYLLFIPSIKPYDIYNAERKCSLGLYVRSIFITSDGVELLPRYMRFVKGIVNAEGIELNIGRNATQNQTKINKIRGALTKIVLSYLKNSKEKDKTEYTNFVNNFLPILKEGLCEAIDVNTRESLLELCMFKTTKSNNEWIDIADYIKRMPSSQKTIYYMIGSSISEMMNSPKIEGFLDKDIEVILLTDDVDNFWTNVVTEYKSTKIKSVNSSEVNLNEETSESESNEDDKNKKSTEEKSTEVENFINYCKEVLKDKVSDIKQSKKLVSSPACISLPTGSFDFKMEKFLIEQKQLLQKTAKIMEININHSIISKMISNLDQNGKSDNLKDKIIFLYDSVCISEGEELRDANDHFKRSINLLETIL